MKIKNWDREIKELEDFFKRANIPDVAMGMYGFLRAGTDLNLLIDSHMKLIRANNGNPDYRKYLDRLQELQRNLLRYQ